MLHILALLWLWLQTALKEAPPDMTTVVTLLTPAVVWLATQAVSWILTKFQVKLSPMLITAVIVPVLSLAAAFLASWAGGTNAWYIQIILGFAGTFVYELINNFKKAALPTASVASLTAGVAPQSTVEGGTTQLLANVSRAFSNVKNDPLAIDALADKLKTESVALSTPVVVGTPAVTPAPIPKKV